ncbi:MAG: VOC family protein [Verrucomicrobia bacterium]|nr:VOC family protein [Verrucomicrobiota bacterium]
MSSLRYPTLTFSIAVPDAARAIEFYQLAFGAVELYRLVDPETQKIGHAELTVGDSLFMVSDEYPAFNQTPQRLGGVSARFVLMVDDVDATVARAVAAGAQVKRSPKDQFYGFRSAGIIDPAGHEWMVQKQLETLTPTEMQARWNSMVSTPATTA